MARSLQISFDADGARVVPDAAVTGLKATVQKAGVHVGTIPGTDSAFPDRGTGLVPGQITVTTRSNSAQRHALRFAALDVLEFFTLNDPTAQVSRLDLEADSSSGDSLSTKLTLVTTTGQNSTTLALS